MSHIYVTPDDRLQKVFDGAAPGSVIHLSAGVYRQKTVIRTKNLTIVGAGEGKTRIVFDDYARKRDDEGFEYITFRSYTMAVCADGVTMENLSILNDAGNPEEKGQQVALSVVGSDFTMKHCTLHSTQDTLFVGPLPEDLIERYDGFLMDELRRSGEMTQLFSKCTICGSVDFIFGCGNAVFDHCQIRSVKEKRSVGYVAAPAHGKEQTMGFRFQNCDFTAEEGVEAGAIYLARPWRDYGMTKFFHCRYGGHISPAGFDKWNDTHRDRTARFYEAPLQSGRVPWAKEKQEDLL